MLHSLQEALAHSCRVRGLDTHQASGACERNHKGSSPAIEAAGGRGNLEAFRVQGRLSPEYISME